MISHLRALIKMNLFILQTLFWYACLLLSPKAWRPKIKQLWAKSSCAILSARIEVSGPLPERPFFLVSNHLSYMDIMVMMTVLDCNFVAKSDIQSWPLVGSICKAAGTIFIKRESRSDVARVGDLIHQNLMRGQNVVVFAEGTSSGGDAVLPFRSSLLEHACVNERAVHYSSLYYESPNPQMPAHQTICWWGEMTLLDHFWRLCRLPYFDVRLRFGDESLWHDNRKDLAKHLYEAVSLGLESVK